MTTKIILSTLLLLPALALAVVPGQGKKEAYQGLRFEDLREACLNPAKFHNQAAPTNIQVSCADVHYKWVIDGNGSLPMRNTRMITTAVYSDKYTVSPVTAAVPATDQSVACPVLREVIESVETVQNVSCTDLIAYQGTGIEFCAAAIDSLRVANQQAVIVKETGKIVSLCERGKYND